jgi:hypothetical protein
VEGVVLGDESFALAGRQARPARHGPQQGVERIGGVLNEYRHRGNLNVPEQVRDVPAGHLIAPEPCLRLRHVVVPLRGARERPIEISLDRPRAGELGCDPRKRGAEGLLILGAARVLQSKVGEECDRPAVDEGIGDEQRAEESTEFRRSLQLAPVPLRSPQQLVGVADDAGPLKLADAIDRLGGTAAAEREVAAVDHVAERAPLDVGYNRLERREIAVDVRDDRERHSG